MPNSPEVTVSAIDGFLSQKVALKSASAKAARRQIRDFLKAEGGKIRRVAMLPGKIIVTTDAPNGLSVLNQLFALVQGVTVTKLDAMVAIQLLSTGEESANTADSQ
jgi:hypothetical protein